MPKLQQFSIYLGQAKSDYQQSSNLVNELEKYGVKLRSVLKREHPSFSLSYFQNS
ncbi:hypothetical protein AAAC51_05990 [Priestia megaterium]